MGWIWPVSIVTDPQFRIWNCSGHHVFICVAGLCMGNSLTVSIVTAKEDSDTIRC